MSRRKNIILSVIAVVFLAAGLGGFMLQRTFEAEAQSRNTGIFRSRAVGCYIGFLGHIKRLRPDRELQGFEEALQACLDAEPLAKQKLLRNMAFNRSWTSQRRKEIGEYVPVGLSVQPLLQSCMEYLDVQENVWLPEMTRLFENMEKGHGIRPFEVRGAWYRCVKADSRAIRDLGEKLLAFDKEFEPELTKQQVKLYDLAQLQALNNPDLERNEQAEVLAVQFGKAIAAKDLDGLMKIAGVPWYDNLEVNGKILNDRDQLKKELQQFLQQSKVNSEYKVEEVLLFQTLVKDHGPEFKGDTRELLARILKDDDRVVSGSFGSAQPPRRLLLFVRRQAGQDRLVGMQEP
jgi:hypothetical protein